MAGLNSLSGGSGNDQLLGGLGNVTLTGGAGSDRFVFDALKGSTNVDKVTDFVSGTDKLVLDDDIFTALHGTAAGMALAAGECKFITSGAGFAAGEANDHLIHNTVTDKLYDDADGKGAGAAVQMATIVMAGNAHPVGEDFLLVE